MSRLLRGTLSCLYLLSLLACLGSVGLWWHSYRGEGGRSALHLDLRLPGGPYRLRSVPGRVEVYSLPRGQPKEQAALRRWLRRFHNSDLRWFTQLSPDGNAPTDRPALLQSAPPIDQVECGLTPQAEDGAYRPLVEALWDPDRFALAHMMLVTQTSARVYDPRDGAYVDRAGRHIEIDCYDLRMRLPSGGEGWDFQPFSEHGFAAWAAYRGPAAGYDLAPMAKVRDLWFNRMARRTASLPDWGITFAAALPSLLWLALRYRRRLVLRRRRRLGLCPRCGYDLAGNASGRCSECGEKVEPVRANGTVTT